MTSGELGLALLMVLVLSHWIFIWYLMYLGDLDIWHDRRRFYTLAATGAPTNLVVIAAIYEQSGCLG